MKISFFTYGKNYFRINGFALSLAALKHRLVVTRNWLIFDKWNYFSHDARRSWEHGIENLNLKFQSRWRIHQQAAQARCINYGEFRYCVIFFFSYYESFKEFVCAIQYNLCTELGPPVIQPILYSFIVFNKGCRVLDLVHTPHNIFIDPPPSLLLLPPFSSWAAL